MDDEAVEEPARASSLPTVPSRILSAEQVYEGLKCAFAEVYTPEVIEDALDAFLKGTTGKKQVNRKRGVRRKLTFYNFMVSALTKKLKEEQDGDHEKKSGDMMRQATALYKGLNDQTREKIESLYHPLVEDYNQRRLAGEQHMNTTEAITKFEEEKGFAMSLADHIKALQTSGNTGG